MRTRFCELWLHISSSSSWWRLDAGADFDAKVAASGPNGLVAVPQDHWVAESLVTQEFAKGPTVGDFEQWPVWALSIIVSRVYAEAAVLSVYATDGLLFPAKIKETLGDAEQTGFLARPDGCVTWTSLEALAHDLAEHARAQRLKGNTGPYELDDSSLHDFHSPPIPHGDTFEVLNELIAHDLRDGDGIPVAFLRLPILFYPFTPAPDFLDGTEAAVVLAYVQPG